MCAKTSFHFRVLLKLVTQPYRTLPQSSTLLCRILSRTALSYPTVPHPALSCLVISRTLPHPASSCLTLPRPHPASPCLIMPRPVSNAASSCLTLPYSASSCLVHPHFISAWTSSITFHHCLFPAVLNEIISRSSHLPFSSHRFIHSSIYPRTHPFTLPLTNPSIQLSTMQDDQPPALVIYPNSQPASH